jgi:hypothetical protein
LATLQKYIPVNNPPPSTTEWIENC